MGRKREGLKKKERGVKRGRADADFDERRRGVKWVLKHTARAGAGAAGSGIVGCCAATGDKNWEGRMRYLRMDGAEG